LARPEYAIYCRALKADQTAKSPLNLHHKTK